MLRSLGKLNRFARVLGGLGKSADFRKAHDEPRAAKDGRRHRQTEVVLSPLGWESSQCFDTDLDRALIVAAIVVRLLDAGLVDVSKSDDPVALVDLHAASPGRESLLQTVQCREDGR